MNTANRKDIRALEKAAALLEQNRGEVVRAIMSTEPGRRYLWERLEAAHIFNLSFSENPIQMAFREGERNQGIMLLNDLMQWCPEQFIEAMRENNARRTDDTARSATAEHAGSENGDGRDQGSAINPADEGPGYVHDDAVH